jgi:hypothetical protein
MKGMREKFTVRITDSGVVIRSGEGKSLHFTAGEALMLLDILRNEEPKLKQMAEEARPMPIQVNV